MKKLLDDCFLHDKDRLTHEEAINILRERLSAITSIERILLESASGRILGENVMAPRDIPATDNSAVDGYTFAHADHEPTGGYFPVAGRIAAGKSDAIELPGFSASRIFTGAPMPAGADTVAMQEDCELHTQDGSQFVIVPQGLKKGANCRKAGEDVAKGEVVAHSAQILRPQDLAAISSTGTPEVNVHTKLRIGLISSGNEIIRPGSKFSTGNVFDSNHFMIRALLDALPVQTSDLGVWKDNAEWVTSELKAASKKYDVLISTGGASRGEEDHFIDALEKLGNCHLWQLAIKPGRPIGFGQISDTPCFVLPGNPVAAFVCFLLYVRPSLIRLAGGNWESPTRYKVPAGFALNSKPDRREFLRGYLDTDKSGNMVVRKFLRDGSGLISGLQAATGLIEISEATTSITDGEQVDFIPLSEFGIHQH